jgi:hypothetical protein
MLRSHHWRLNGAALQQSKLATVRKAAFVEIRIQAVQFMQILPTVEQQVWKFYATEPYIVRVDFAVE